MRKKKHLPQSDAYVVGDGTCGRCLHWSGDTDDLDSFGHCRLLAIDHRRGPRVQVADLPELRGRGRLVTEVMQRERSAREAASVYVTLDAGRVVGIEDVQDLPQERPRDDGGTTRIWSFLPTRAFGACSRHAVSLMMPAPAVYQPSLIGVQ